MGLGLPRGVGVSHLREQISTRSSRKTDPRNVLVCPPILELLDDALDAERPRS